MDVVLSRSAVYRLGYAGMLLSYRWGATCLFMMQRSQQVNDDEGSEHRDAYRGKHLEQPIRCG